MTLTLTTQQLLRAWRVYSGLEPVNNGCSIERFDSIDIDSVLAARLRQWYLALLDCGDSRFLGPPSDVSDNVHLDGSSLTLDDTVRRLTVVRLSNWLRDAEVVRPVDVAPVIALCDNPYSAPGPASPLAWQRSCREIVLAPVIRGADGPAVIKALGYLDPGEDKFILDQSAISQIPFDIINNVIL